MTEPTEQGLLNELRRVIGKVDPVPEDLDFTLRLISRGEAPGGSTPEEEPPKE
ncbi:hypothetical protein ACRYCC_25090 [Actinomadura scrupuli]|uniref:hypothetical protein n=1 Tax=Actinomadura scrupuli TaxID=559629 RepID=UPI003D99B088